MMNNGWKYFFHDLRWWSWKLLHPFQPYGVFYSAFIAERIRKGNRHPTLGQVPENEEHYRKNAEERILHLQSEHGLSEHTRFVDYGCGGGRIGKLLIPLLDKGCYWGLDISGNFFHDGYNSLSKTLMEDKSPRLDVISPESLACVRDFSPQMIYVGGVLHHVPPRGVDRFLNEVSQIIVDGTVCLITNRSGKHKRLGLMRWAYDPEKLAVKLVNRGLSLTSVPDPVLQITDLGTVNEILVVCRAVEE